MELILSLLLLTESDIPADFAPVEKVPVEEEIETINQSAETWINKDDRFARAERDRWEIKVAREYHRQKRMIPRDFSQHHNVL